jgi:hypothetical protein
VVDIIKLISKRARPPAIVFVRTNNPAKIKNIPKKMNGTLIKQKGVEAMPEGKYLDLNFVSNSYKAMQSALTDIYTAKDVRTVKSMLDSDGIKKVINSKDLAVLKEKVALYVKRSRNMDAIDYDELSKLSKRLADVNRFITSASLGSLKQPIGQTFPLAIKTLIGAGRFDLADAASITASIYSGVDSPVNRFLNQSGYGINDNFLGDLRLTNVGYDKDGEIKILDFNFDEL